MLRVYGCVGSYTSADNDPSQVFLENPKLHKTTKISKRWELFENKNFLANYERDRLNKSMYKVSEMDYYFMMLGRFE